MLFCTHAGPSSHARPPAVLQLINGTDAGFKAVALGETHALALRQDGAVYAWGSSSWGQNADPNRATLSTPTMVLLP